MSVVAKIKSIVAKRRQQREKRYLGPHINIFHGYSCKHYSQNDCKAHWYEHNIEVSTTRNVDYVVGKCLPLFKILLYVLTMVFNYVTSGYIITTGQIVWFMYIHALTDLYETVFK